MMLMVILMMLASVRGPWPTAGGEFQVASSRLSLSGGDGHHC